jgi:ATP-binding cassette subfamily G (WHITE) protein 2 (PDR)
MESRKDDIETGFNSEKSGNASRDGKEEVNIQKQTSIVSWKDVTYDIKIKGEERRILDNVDGWVKPGTLTALMVSLSTFTPWWYADGQGVSGAGKTTLLDVLATRVTMGIVGGKVLVDGKPRDESFQRKTGYVQQQDVHLETSTIREALEFSALLRQPRHVPKAEKIAYVDEVLKLLEMEHYANAVIGAPGEGQSNWRWAYETSDWYRRTECW